MTTPTPAELNSASNIPNPSELGFVEDWLAETIPDTGQTNDQVVRWSLEDIAKVALNDEERDIALQQLRTYVISKPETTGGFARLEDEAAGARILAEYAADVIAAFPQGVANLRIVLRSASRNAGIQAAIINADPQDNRASWDFMHQPGGVPLAKAIHASAQLARMIWAQEHGGNFYTFQKIS